MFCIIIIIIICCCCCCCRFLFFLSPWKSWMPRSKDHLQSCGTATRTSALTRTARLAFTAPWVHKWSGYEGLLWSGGGRWLNLPITLPETNMAPDNGWCWNTFSFPQLGCCLFSGAFKCWKFQGVYFFQKKGWCTKHGQLKATNVPLPQEIKPY